MLNLIIAADNDWGIGYNNDLLYHFSSDLKRFKELTSGATVVMGRKTWDSLPKKLPNRKNIVISRSESLHSDKTPDFVFNTIEPVIELAKSEDVWIIGGAEMIKMYLPYIKRIELTKVNYTKQADTNIDFLRMIDVFYKLEKSSKHSEVDKLSNQEIEFEFMTYTRKDI